MIRLCIITTVPSTIKVLFSDQLDFLRSNGFDVTVITSGRTAGYENLGRDLPASASYKSVSMSRLVRPWEDTKAFFAILGILRAGRFDIVEYTTPKAAILGSAAAWLLRVPVRLYLMWGLYYVTQTGLKRSIFKLFEKIICFFSTDVSPDSFGNRDFAVREGLCRADKLSVVSHGSTNGVDVERFNPVRLTASRSSIRSELKIPPDAKVFGTICSIVTDKGVNETVEAFLKIHRQFPNSYLIIIGCTTEKDPVKASTSRQFGRILRFAVSAGRKSRKIPCRYGYSRFSELS